MKIKILKETISGAYDFYVGEVIEIDGNDTILMDLNDEYYLLVYHGIRFNLHKKDVEVIDEECL